MLAEMDEEFGIGDLVEGAMQQKVIFFELSHCVCVLCMDILGFVNMVVVVFIYFSIYLTYGWYAMNYNFMYYHPATACCLLFCSCMRGCIRTYICVCANNSYVPENRRYGSKPDAFTMAA